MLSRYWRLLRTNRNFRLIWTAQIVSEIGDWFYALSVYSLLLELTGNRAQSVGLAVVLQVLPQTFAAPMAGVVNDRARRKTVMIGADVARCLIVLGMIAVRTPATVWLVYPLLLLETVAAAFFEPARNAAIPRIVPEGETGTANALGSITWSVSLAIGSALGGIAAAVAGRDAVFAINAASFLVSAWLIRRTRFSEEHVAGAPPLRARDLADFRPVLDGLRYIASNRRRLATVFVKGGIGLLGANNVVLPVLGSREFAVHGFGLSPERGAMLGMSVLLGARGVGSLIGPLLANAWADDRAARMRNGILGGFLLAGGGYLCLAAAPWFTLAAFCVMAAHAGASINWVFSTTLLQNATDDGYRGRVFSADIGLCMLTIAITSYLAGVAIDWGVPIRTFAAAMGAVMLIPSAAWALALRSARGR